MSAESLPEGQEQGSNPKAARDLFPFLEDWEALQGGRPRIFHNPKRPQSVWIVLHVYEEHPDAKKRFKSGEIVQTTPPEDGKFKMLRKLLTRRDEDGHLIDRDFMIPSIMDRSVHGDPCGVRSGSQGRGSYDRIRSQAGYEAKVEKLISDGFEELRFGVNNEGFTLKALPHITHPKPLGE